MSVSPIPAGLKQLLPYPNTPWQIGTEALKRIPQNSDRFKKWGVSPTDPETQFVTHYFLHHKPHGYAIAKICIIHHPFHTQGFEAELVNIDEEAKKFLPRWNTEEGAEERKGVITRWKSQVKNFDPIEVSGLPLTSAKILPLWHGSSVTKCESICSSGFTYFGKHHFFDHHASGDAANTDIGYFGSGIYFTNSAHYASIYSNGHLLLSWVSMREPYPVITDLPAPKKGRDTPSYSKEKEPTKTTTPTISLSSP